MLTNEQFTAYVRRYLNTVYRVALNYLKSAADAEDVTQEAFIKLLGEKKCFESDEHVRSWLIRVAINECKNLTRKHWRREENIDDYAATIPFEDARHSDLFYAVMDLPKHYRLPLYLHYYEDYTTQEIADILKVPKNTVCTQLRRGRELLKETLTEVDANV
ncbi:MAG: sigma-70 family RNA polymerase sigma factor [Eubacteriales bacterium]|nr:sigma-70 family RNA polymerase sigma factor [Eubacteriales bacterium]